MKKPVISVKLHSGHVEINGERYNPRLPNGCIGIMFAFESKKAAREFDSKAELCEIEWPNKLD